MELQAQIGEQYDTERYDRCSGRHTQRSEPAALDVERIEPHDVIRQRRVPCQPQLRAHDAWHDEYARRTVTDAHRARATRKRGERAVLGRSEVVAELGSPLAA